MVISRDIYEWVRQLIENLVFLKKKVNPPIKYVAV